MSGVTAPRPVGRVLQVSVNHGGVPKLPVERAWVGRYGLEGDRVRERTVHGGPFRAVCLFGIEVIQRLRDEGHPVTPGSVGENLTTEGVEWSVQPPGTRIQVGDTVLLELTTPANPCATQKANFHDGRFGRISVLTHPSDSRMYAMVLCEGEIRPGDPITLLSAVRDSQGERAALFARLDQAEKEADLRLWGAAAAAGYDIRIFEDGEIAAAAAPDLPGPPWNQAVGLRGLPNLVPLVLDHFRAHGTRGSLVMAQPPWAGATPDHQQSVLAGATSAVAEAEAVMPAGVIIRPLQPTDADASIWADLVERGDLGLAPGVGARLAPHLLRSRGFHLFVAEEDGRAVARAMLSVRTRVGLLRTGHVVAAARGRGLQRGLIAARVSLARELGCDVVAARAGPGSVSERNLVALGLDRLAVLDVYGFDPADPPADLPAGPV